jgi:hypothetical protein
MEITHNRVGAESEAEGSDGPPAGCFNGSSLAPELDVNAESWAKLVALSEKSLVRGLLIKPDETKLQETVAEVLRANSGLKRRLEDVARTVAPECAEGGTVDATESQKVTEGQKATEGQKPTEGQKAAKGQKEDKNDSDGQKKHKENGHDHANDAKGSEDSHHEECPCKKKAREAAEREEQQKKKNKNNDAGGHGDGSSHEGH